jgi:hypothetical protein
MEHTVAHELLQHVVAQARDARLMSREHLTVDGTAASAEFAL